MKIITYHENRVLDAQTGILDRASRRAHLLKRTVFWDIGTFLFTAGSSVLLRMYADALGNIPMLRCFLPINESVFEQTKLLFFPSFLLTIIRWLTTGDLQKGILTTFTGSFARSFGLFVMLSYSVQGVLGFTGFWLSTGLLALTAGYLAWDLHRHAGQQQRTNLPGILLLPLWEAAVIWCTYHPPGIGLFRA